MPDLLSGLPFGPFTRMEEVSFFSGLFKSLTSATHTHTQVLTCLARGTYVCLCVCVCTSIKLSDHRKKKKCRREIVEQQRQLCCSSGICSSLGYSAGKSDRGRIGSKEGELYRIYIYVYILLKWAKRTLGLCTKLRRTGQRITNECKPCQGVSLVIWIWYKEC